MNRRWIFRLLTGVAVMVPLAGRRALAEGESKTHRLALHVSENDANAMKRALGNARNAYDFYEQRGGQIAIEIVANGPGLHMLRDDTSPVKQEIRDLRAKVPQVVFGACEHTKDAMEKHEGKPVPMIAEVTMVPSGVVRLLQLQDEGYAYVKP
ncbi:MAG: DsrE family protein [Bradyrhizobiaceae bacterium]|nr:DsrE family protein [Bradyrhizobiaceae bacterium]